MKSFKLPKKKKLKSFFKLFLTLNLLFGLGALGLFFYFSYEKNNPLLSALSPFFPNQGNQDVLAVSVGPVPLKRIELYDFTPRSSNNTSASTTGVNDLGLYDGGVSNSPIFPASCANLSNQTSFAVAGSGCITDDAPTSNFGWRESPPVLQAWGSGGSQIPVLFYSGGMYQVKDRNKVQLISKLYSGDCHRGWYPFSVDRDKRDQFYFGHSALTYTQGSCRPMVNGVDQQQFYREGTSRPNHFQYQVRLKNTGGDLSIDKVWMWWKWSNINYSPSNDYWNPSHYTYCLGKDLDGRCEVVQVHKYEGSSEDAFRMTSEGNNIDGFRSNSYLTEGYCGNTGCFGGEHLKAWVNGQICNARENFQTLLGTKRKYWRLGSGQCLGGFSGYDIPKVFFDASSRSYNNQFDSFTYNQPYRSASGSSTSSAAILIPRNSYLAGFYQALGTLVFDFRAPRLVNLDDKTTYDNDYNTVYVNQSLDAFKNLSAFPIFVTDYTSDAYYFRLTYVNNTIFIYRFGLSEIPYPGITRPRVTGIVVPGLNISNVSFNVSGRGDLDIMFGPNTDSVDSTSRTRIFRVPRFNNVDPYDFGPQSVMYEMTDAPNGYGFTSSGATGLESPLSFEYINVADGNLTNDYAVFATKNSVWTANIPYDCQMNEVTATFQSDSNSRLNGVRVPPSGNPYSLSFNLNATPSITCGSSNDPISGYELELVDPLNTSGTIARVLSSSTPQFSNNANGAYRSKLNMKLFVKTVGGNRIAIPINGADASGNFSFIEEGTIQLRVFKKLANGSTAPHNGAVFSIAQKFFQLSGEPLINKPVRGVALGSTSNTTTLSSTSISNYFFDHRIMTVANNSLRIMDLVTTEIYFIPQNAYQSQDGNYVVDIVSVSPTDSFILVRGGMSPALPSRRSLSFYYNVANSGTYRYPSNFTLNVVLANVDTPPATGVPTSGYNNISFNSNVSNLTLNPLKGESNSTSASVRDGNYIYFNNSAQSDSFTKRLQLSFPLRSLFEFPIKFTLPTSATSTIPRTSVINPTGCNSSSLNLFNIFNSSGNCSISSGTTNFSSPSLKIVFINSGSVSIDLNASLPSQLPVIRNTYFINNSSNNNPAKVSLNLNCNLNPAPFLCTQGNRFYFSGALYGSAIFNGTLPNDQLTSTKATVSQTGDLLPIIQNYLHSNKATNISIRKVILKYK